MAICKLTITTSVDGERTKIVRMGKIEKEGGWLRLQYREESAEVTLRLSEGRALVSRIGDYSLRLPLFHSEDSEGKLGLGGNEGPVPIRTHEVRYAYADGKLDLILSYDLLFGEEPQKMRLEIQATERGAGK